MSDDEKVAQICAERGWTRTGVFATAAECQRAREWAAEWAATPVAWVHGHWLPDDAEEQFKRRIDGLAMAHGLADRGEDHYGLVVTGEFVVLGREERESNHE